MPKENHSAANGGVKSKNTNQEKNKAKPRSSLKRPRAPDNENQKTSTSKVTKGISNKQSGKKSKDNKQLNGKIEQQDSDSSDEAPEEMNNEVAKSLFHEAEISKETTIKSSSKKEKETQEKKKTKTTTIQDEQEDSKSKSLPTPLSLDVLSKAQNKGAPKSVPIPNPETCISSNISPENLKQKNNKIKKAKTQKAFGDIRVKVLKERNPWDLPPIKIDKGASDFLQTALYSNRTNSRQRKQIGLSLDPNIIGPAPKFVREQI